MTADQILAWGPELAKFLEEFADCFVRSEPRGHLADYVRGQLSDVPHKCVEPIADLAGIKPRTLQEFLNTDQWQHAKLRDHVQRIIARDHADPQAIGIIGELRYRPKYDMALEQLDGALASGVRFRWLTCHNSDSTSGTPKNPMSASPAGRWSGVCKMKRVSWACRILRFANTKASCGIC